MNTPELAPYTAFMDSGVPWLGDVPAHWGVLAGRACYRERRVPNTGLVESTVLSLSYGQIVVKPQDKLHGLVPASFETYQIVEPGNIIVRPTDLQNDWNSLRFGLSKHRGIITSAYMCLETSEAVSRDYGHLVLHSYDLKKVFYGLGSGLRQNLDWRDFKYLPVVVPPPDEQAAIVRYLDHVDRRIRRYIRAKQKLIKLLEEQRQAVIQRAVTRGINGIVRLKPTGMKWLAEVPEHWTIKPAKYFFREADDRSTSGSQELLSVSHITGVTSRSQKNITMFMAESYVGHKLCQPGDLVINTMWAWMGALGVARQAGIVSPAYGVYRPIANSPLSPEFADSLLRTPAYISEYVMRSTGIRSSRLRLYPEQFLRLQLVCPPIDEQRRILSFVEEETGNVQKAIDRANRQIALLREYRTRLIADVVTGKLDVRAAAAALPAEPGDLAPDADALAEELPEDLGGESAEFADAELTEETD